MIGVNETRDGLRIDRAEICGKTDRGRVRSRNEDHFLVAHLGEHMVVAQTSLPDVTEHGCEPRHARGQLLVVADGVGGQAGGDRASRIAVDTLASSIAEFAPSFVHMHEASVDERVARALARLIERCGRRIEGDARRSGLRGMSTTLTMACVLWPKLFVVHVGDSRCYLHRHRKLLPDRLEQITTDHTLAQKLVEQGVIPREQDGTNRFSNVLWNAVGGNQSELSPEVHELDLQDGDQLLLCTDGLTKHVSDAEIRRVLGEAESTARACARLIEAANEAGGTDNVTAVVGRFHEAESA